MNLLKSHLILLLVNARQVAPVVIRHANCFFSLKFGKVQLLDIVELPGGATNFNSFLPESLKNIRDEIVFLIDLLGDQEKLDGTQLPHNEAFFKILLINNLLEEGYSEFHCLIHDGITT